MKTAFGLLLILAGVILGFYVGGWICFVGGIVDIIESFKAPEVVATDVGVGVLKIVSASFCGVISALVLLIPGCAMLD